MGAAAVHDDNIKWLVWLAIIPFNIGDNKLGICRQVQTGHKMRKDDLKLTCDIKTKTWFIITLFRVVMNLQRITK